MSGGVESSVAAALLAEEGHEVIGLSMQLYDQTGPEQEQVVAQKIQPVLLVAALRVRERQQDRPLLTGPP